MRKKTIKILFFNSIVFLFSLFLVFCQKTFAIDNCNEGWQVNVGTSKRIDCHGICREVTNNCESSIFVPTGSYKEWEDFLTHTPSCVSLKNCTLSISSPSPVSSPSSRREREWEEPPPEEETTSFKSTFYFEDAKPVTYCGESYYEITYTVEWVCPDTGETMESQVTLTVPESELSTHVQYMIENGLLGGKK